MELVEAENIDFKYDPKQGFFKSMTIYSLLKLGVNICYLNAIVKMDRNP